MAILTDLTIPAQFPTRGDRLFRIENERYLCPCVGTWRTGAPSFNAHCEPLPGGRYRLVFHPPIEFPANCVSSGNGPGLLGPIRARCTHEPRAVALDVQTLALSSAGTGPALYPFYANPSLDSSADSRKERRT